MERKDFIKLCGMACLGGTAVSALLQGCATASHFAKASANNNRVTVNKAEFVQAAGGNAAYRKFVLVKVEQLSSPICIFRFSDGDYSALLMQCTHKGCELQPQGQFLTCPCHGSEFNNRGVVQNPPAQENLRSFALKTDNENIYIQL